MKITEKLIKKSKKLIAEKSKTISFYVKIKDGFCVTLKTNESHNGALLEIGIDKEPNDKLIEFIDKEDIKDFYKALGLLIKAQKI